MSDILLKALAAKNASLLGDLSILPIGLRDNLAFAVKSMYDSMTKINVRQPPYNLKADGTDDIQKLQDLFDLARDNGSVALDFPQGTYAIYGRSGVRLYKNTFAFLHTNATFKRIGTDHKMFMNGEMDNDNYASGYDGDGNIHFVGGTIDLNGVGSGIGSDQTLSAFDMSHGENISFEGVKVINGQIGHYFQITGCKNVLFRNCWFGNVDYTDTTSTSYELLQIETATSSSFPTFGKGDYTISRDIFVEECTFDTVIRAIGTHSFVCVATTTGSISSASTSLTVADATKFNVNESIKIEGASSTGGYFSTTILSKNGNVLTLANAAGKSVANSRISNATDSNIPAFFNENIHIRKCIFRNSFDNMINLNAFRYSHIEDNLIDGADGYGIYMTVSEDNIFKGNTITNIQKSGVYLDKSNDNKFMKNTLNEVALIPHTTASYSAFRLFASKGNSFDDDTVKAANPNYSYALYTSDGSDNTKIITHNFTEGRTSIIGGELSFAWCSVGDSITRGDNGTPSSGYYQDYAMPAMSKVTMTYNRGYGGYCAYIPQTISTGSITAGSKILTVANSSGFTVNGHTNIVNGGLNGTNFDSTIVSISGNTITLTDAAPVTVTNGPVRKTWNDSILDVVDDIEVADVYTVFLGTNDFSHNAPLGSVNDAQGTFESFWGGLKQLYVDLTDKNANAIVIFITPLKRSRDSSNAGLAWYEANSLGFTLTDYVNAIKDFASRYGCPVLDLFSESGVSDRTDDNLLIDGVHPNFDCNKRIGKMIGNKINMYI